MKVRVYADEWYPFWIIETVDREYGTEIELTEEELASYKQNVDALGELFESIEKRVKEAK